jgi:hypothetical protein
LRFFPNRRRQRTGFPDELWQYEPSYARTGGWLSALCLAASLDRVAAADFTITSPGSFYTINGMSPNPTLTLIRGETYTFAVNTSSLHPFRINSAGANNNNISSGTITYKVPTNAMNYTYECSIHHFGNQIITVPPPTFRILRLDVGTNLVLKSTGTNNWTVFPQFSTNLSTTNWSALTVRSNNFLNGTNEIVCGKPPGSKVFIRLRAQRN